MQTVVPDENMVRRPSPEARHAGRDARFINECQTGRVPVFVLLGPVLPRFRDAGTVLFARPKRLSFYVIPSRTSTPWMEGKEQARPNTSRNSAKAVSGDGG